MVAAAACSDPASNAGADTVGGGDAAADSTGAGAGLRVMSFNVLCSFCAKPEHDAWDDRLAALKDIVARHDPDLMGLQELFSVAAGDDSEVLAMMAKNPVYTPIYYHVQPDDALDMDYPDATAYVRTSRFDVLGSGTFWLSPTPDVAFSTGFDPDGQLPRLVAWARLKDKTTDRELIFATTHVDNNAPSQELSAPLILERLAPLAADTPLILVGDFNADPSHVSWQTLTGGVNGAGFHLVDTFEVATQWGVDSDTETKADYVPGDRIDHIFFSAGEPPGGATFSVPQWTVDMQRYGTKNRYPSDHFPIIADLQEP